MSEGLDKSSHWRLQEQSEKHLWGAVYLWLILPSGRQWPFKVPSMLLPMSSVMNETLQYNIILQHSSDLTSAFLELGG